MLLQLLLASLALLATNAAGAQQQTCPTTLTVNLIAYEFPYCLAGKGLLENLFLSRPTDSKITATVPAPQTKSSSQCVPVKASRGVPHSFFFTSDVVGGESSASACKLITFEEEGCKGKETKYELGGKGFSECFTDEAKLVKPLLKSAVVRCG